MLTRGIQTLFYLLLGVIFAFTAIKLQTRCQRLFEQVQTQQDKYYLPPASWLKAFSLGYNEAVADFLWAKTLVYFGDKKTTISQDPSEDDSNDLQNTAIYTVNYVKLISALDPKFLSVYTNGGKLTLYHQGRITKETVNMSIDLVKNGLKNFPDSGALAFQLGFLHYYELPPFLSSEEKIESHRRKGALLIRKASTLEGAPESSSMLASSLLGKQGLHELVIEHLKEMLLHETTPDIRRRLELKLRKEMGAAAIRDIEQGRQLRLKWQKELPYIPFDYFLAMEPNIPISAQNSVNPLKLANQELGIE